MFLCPASTPSMNISNYSHRINTNNETSQYSSCDEFNYCAKRARYDDGSGCHNNKFKGVVPQQNGHWGAQIYANHQRIWLGTFKSESEAAMAYDSATIKLRSNGESHRNFPWNDQTVQEPHFQSLFSVESVLTMIRNGTYPSKFATFLRTTTQSQGIGNLKHNNVNVRVKGSGEEQQFSYTQLFQKQLTPSDVGKLNRLVIPKKHAVTYFPCVCDGANTNLETNDDGKSCVDVEVVFYDKLMRMWKFRYCYWKSSQSYVFTRGWNRFVKDKKLKAKDIIAFYMCEPTTQGREGQVFSLIDVIYNNADHERRRRCFVEKKGEAKQVLGDKDEGQEETLQDRMDLNIALHSTNNAHRGLRLFGVRIN